MDLRSFREDSLKMTQATFSKLIGEEQSNISRWEKNGDPPLSALMKIVKKTGVDFNDLIGYRKPEPKPFRVENTWSKAEFTKRSLLDYISSALGKMELPDEQRKAYIDDYNVPIKQDRDFQTIMTPV